MLIVKKRILFPWNKERKKIIGLICPSFFFFLTPINYECEDSFLTGKRERLCVNVSLVRQLNGRNFK